MLWSILICTLESRAEQFKELHAHLLHQIESNHLENEVEILYFLDDKDYPVGVKRNSLIEAASGEYISFVDDDDKVSENYVSLLYNAMKNRDVDCVGIKGLLISKAWGNKEFIHSLKYDAYIQDEEYFYRPPNHLNPIKKDKIKEFQFKISNYGEDTDWAMKICKAGVLQKETYIDEVVYYYHFDFATTETQKQKIFNSKGEKV